MKTCKGVTEKERGKKKKEQRHKEKSPKQEGNNLSPRTNNDQTEAELGVEDSGADKERWGLSGGEYLSAGL